MCVLPAIWFLFLVSILNVGVVLLLSSVVVACFLPEILSTDKLCFAGEVLSQKILMHFLNEMLYCVSYVATLLYDLLYVMALVYL